MTEDATQDRFLGAILGLAIGDAFGMPVAGWSATTIADWYGVVHEYLPRTFPNGDEISGGEITDETEIALCIIESVTAAQGQVDVENIGIRMSYLARGDSRRWMSAEVKSALDGPSEACQFQLPLVDDESVGADVLARGIPLGLMHSMGPFNDALLRAEVSAVTRITHGSPLALSAVEAVARAVALVARQEAPLDQIGNRIERSLADGEVRELLRGVDSASPTTDAGATLRSALEVVAEASSFEQGLEESVARGGPTDSRAALVGALYGAFHGSAVIPQRLIDGLESRIYVSLAAPWFYRTVARRSGIALQLKPGFG